MGLAELAPVFAKTSEQLFMDTIREIGVQLAEEKDSQLQSLVGAAFVRLAQEATKNRSFPAIQRSVEMIDYVESERPGRGKSLRPSIGVENRLPEFIEESLKAGELPGGLKICCVECRKFPRAHRDPIRPRGIPRRLRAPGVHDGGAGAGGSGPSANAASKGGPTEAIDTIGILARMDIDMSKRSCRNA